MPVSMVWALPEWSAHTSVHPQDVTGSRPSGGIPPRAVAVARERPVGQASAPHEVP